MMYKISLWLLAGLSLLTAEAQNTLMINELMADNSACLADADGDYSDWIEIYNPTNHAISLQGWSLSANKEKPQQWKFPEMELGAGEYLVVFASGKKRAIAGEELHTNFKLSASGEYVALISPQGTAVTTFDSYPSMEEDVSYGYLNGYLFFFTKATPNKANDQSPAIRLPRPEMDFPHGFYDQSFVLELSSGIPDTKIYYTLDGSEPSTSNGSCYKEGINITGTTIVRACAVSANNQYAASKIATQTYLFVDDVAKQSNTPEGYPTSWGPYATRSGTAIADYEMDPEMMDDPDFIDDLKTGLLSLPVVSIVTDKNNLFNQEDDAVTGGIYIYTDPPTGYTKTSVSDPGTGWTRPASFELFDTKDSLSVQEDFGLRLHGGHSRIAEKSPKHSFRMAFKPEYGQSKLNYPLFGANGADEVDNIVLRAGFCNTWIHANTVERNLAVYTRDTWTKTTQAKMGWPASHFIYAHLYINGLYWGLYNPTERIDNNWCETYLGGNKEEYDVIKVEDSPQTVLAGDGNIEAWNTLFTLVAQAANESYYQKIQGNNADGTPNAAYPAYLDVVNFIDYMIINMYGGNTDWDRHNWLAVRNRVTPGSGFRFLCWDSEHVLKTLDQDVGYGENREKCPSIIFGYLMKNPNFCRLFADRVQKHCYNRGVLTPEIAAETWTALSDEIAYALHAESARWGDYRRDVHQWSSAPYELYTKATHYDPVQKEMLESILPGRRDVFIGQVRNLGLFPSIDAPVFKLNEKEILTDTFALNDTLSITAVKGDIYYSTDSYDPVEWASNGVGTLRASAQKYTGEMLLTDSLISINARAFSNNTWSAMNELTLFIPATPDTVVTQPDDSLNCIEYISLTNLKISPNPCLDHFCIHYELAQEAEVSIEIFDINGRKIACIEDGWQGGGSHRIEWNAGEWNAGVYFGRYLCTDRTGRIKTAKFKLIKL